MRQPLYQKVYQNFKEQIENGHLQPDSRLPSIRQMTKEWSISRTTVESAYEQLCADGLVTCVSQSGYYVNAISHKPALVCHEKRKESAKVPVKYDFSGKYMDPNTFDFDIWRRLSRAVMQNSESFLAYGDNQGEITLRRQIARYLSAGRGVYTSQEQIVIAAGIQSLLHILCEMLPKSNLRIAFEDPGFQKGCRIFEDHGYDMVFVKGGQSGIEIDELYASKANMLYISPSHSFPSGATLPYEKRLRLLQWASDVDGIIFEDDYDGELRYTGKPFATLTSQDGEDRVIYLGTFSKLLPPSIRISYAALPHKWLPAYLKIASRYNQTSSTMEQLTMARFLEEGRLEKQVRRLRRIYGRKNEAITHAFRLFFGETAKVQPNDTGLHVIVSLKLQTSAEDLCRRARREGILLVPMSSYQFEADETKTAEIYMSCASIKEEDIFPAVSLLKKLWDSDK